MAESALIPVLHATISTDQAERNRSIAQLLEWESMPGFAQTLIEVVGAKSVPVPVRTQAILFFKNSIDRIWRRGSKQALDVNSKNIVKAKLLSLLDEENAPIAKTLALCVAKIARLDYVQDWPNLFTDLLHAMQQSFGNDHPQAKLVLQRSLLTMQQCIKILSSNRMLRGKAIMAKAVNECWSFVMQIYRQTYTSWTQAAYHTGLTLKSPGPHDVHISLLCLKILSKLAIYGWGGQGTSDAERQPMILEQQAFIRSTIPQISSLVDLRKHLLSHRDTLLASPEAKQLLEFVNKHLMNQIKLCDGLLKQDHKLFHAIGSTPELIQVLWEHVVHAAENIPQLVSDEVDAVYPERFLVKSISLVKCLFTQWPMCDPASKNPKLALSMVQVIVTRLMPLQQKDLAKWEDDAEEWIDEEAQERFEFDLRPAAERLLMDLMKQYKDEASPLMSQMLQTYSNPTDMHGLLIKEALYAAFGHNPTELIQAVKFDIWLDQHLGPEAHGTEPNSMIIRRRIASLLGNWVGEDLSQASRVKIYQILIYLLQRNPSTDMAIRLTAAHSLSKCDTWDFDPSTFLPYLSNAVEELLDLLSTTELPETRMRMINSLGLVIERVRGEISPYASRLVETMTSIWVLPETPDHLRVSIVVFMKRLVDALGPKSSALLPQICTFVQLSVEPSSPSFVFLHEDGLDLWQAMMRQAQSSSPEVFSLLPLAVGLLKAGSDTLRVILKILESYIMLDPTATLQLCSADIFTGIEYLLTDDVKLEALISILHAVNTIVKSSQPQMYAAALDQSGCFSKFLLPLRKEDYPVLNLGKYLCTLSRICLADVNTFLHLIASASTRLEMSEDDILDLLIKTWIEKHDTVSQARNRKLVALSLTCLLSTHRPVVLKYFELIISIWTGVFSDTYEPQDEGADPSLYHLEDDYASEVEYNDDETAPEARRRSHIRSQDPVTTIDFPAIVKSTVGNLEGALGPQSFQALLATVDPAVLQELQKRL